MTTHNHPVIEMTNGPDTTCTPACPAYRDDRPDTVSDVLDRLRETTNAVDDAVSALQHHTRNVVTTPSGADKAHGPHLARFYRALGVNPAGVGSGAFEVEAYSADTIIVRYPGQVVVSRKVLTDALNMMAADQ